MNFVGAISWKIFFAFCLLIFVKHGEAGKLADLPPEEEQPTIIEGDIVVDRDLLRMIEQGNGRRQKRVAFKTANLWDDGLIPYTIASDVSDNFRRIIRRAFRRMAAKTCIRFIPKQKTDKHYIHFKQGKGCYSSVGRQDGGQVISLGATCETRYRALHEIMHALGFLHEHSRPDRDKYIRILFWNIEEGQDRKNFGTRNKTYVDTLSEPYDFNSILHYDNKAFSKNGLDTIQAINATEKRFGHAKHLSKGDVRQIRKLYKCDRRRAKLNAVGGQQDICANKIEGCKHYTEQGDACESNYEFTNILCQKACGFCSNG